MAFLGHWWLLLALIIVLIVIGPGKLPQVGGAIGQAIRDFRRSSAAEATTDGEADAAPKTIGKP